MAHRRRTFPAGARRKTTWVGPADQGFVVVAANTQVIISSFTPGTQGLPQPTVIRSRGIVSVVFDDLTADRTVVGAWGIGVVSQEAFIAGQAAIPGPWSEAGWDGWLAWGTFGNALEFVTGTGSLLSSTTEVVDSKGMRKVTDGEVIVLMAESEATAFRIAMNIRMLLKLS